VIPLALTRGDLADYVNALFIVYVILIFIRIVASFVPRMPYNPYLGAVLDFAQEVTDPYLIFWRRLIPSFGGAGGFGLDLSPMVGLLVLFVAQKVVVNLIAG
jgi:YggT family protein